MSLITSATHVAFNGFDQLALSAVDASSEGLSNYSKISLLSKYTNMDVDAGPIKNYSYVNTGLTYGWTPRNSDDQYFGWSVEGGTISTQRGPVDRFLWSGDIYVTTTDHEANYLKSTSVSGVEINTSNDALSSTVIHSDGLMIIPQRDIELSTTVQNVSADARQTAIKVKIKYDDLQPYTWVPLFGYTVSRQGNSYEHQSLGRDMYQSEFQNSSSRVPLTISSSENNLYQDNRHKYERGKHTRTDGVKEFASEVHRTCCNVADANDLMYFIYAHDGAGNGMVATCAGELAIPVDEAVGSYPDYPRNGHYGTHDGLFEWQAPATLDSAEPLFSGNTPSLSALWEKYGGNNSERADGYGGYRSMFRVWKHYWREDLMYNSTRDQTLAETHPVLLNGIAITDAGYTDAYKGIDDGHLSGIDRLYLNIHHNWFGTPLNDPAITTGSKYTGHTGSHAHGYMDNSIAIGVYGHGIRDVSSGYGDTFPNNSAYTMQDQQGIEHRERADWLLFDSRTTGGQINSLASPKDPGACNFNMGQLVAYGPVSNADLSNTTEININVTRVVANGKTIMSPGIAGDVNLPELIEYGERSPSTGPWTFYGGSAPANVTPYQLFYSGRILDFTFRDVPGQVGVSSTSVAETVWDRGNNSGAVVVYTQLNGGHLIEHGLSPDALVIRAPHQGDCKVYSATLATYDQVTGGITGYNDSVLSNNLRPDYDVQLEFATGGTSYMPLKLTSENSARRVNNAGVQIEAGATPAWVDTDHMFDEDENTATVNKLTGEANAMYLELNGVITTNAPQPPDSRDITNMTLSIRGMRQLSMVRHRIRLAITDNTKNNTLWTTGTSQDPDIIVEVNNTASFPPQAEAYTYVIDQVNLTYGQVKDGYLKIWTEVIG